MRKETIVMLTDTIAAISTGGNNSGINIIKISGENALELIKKIFTNYGKVSHQKIVYGKILNCDNGQIIDEVLVSYFKAPHSFTGEDVCEINCHGGRRVTLDILQMVLRNGARIAEAGEFSKRAFLNGKIDLSKAEAVIDVINAKTSLQTKVAMNQLEGELNNKVTEIRNKLVDIMAEIEVSIDYPEYDYVELTEDNLIKRLEEQKENVENLLSTYNNGKYIKEGINLAIVGNTNVGKSSLLNALLKKDRAIVTDIEGTTRDVLEETMILGDLVINISDTAGIRETNDIVEAIGVKKSIETIDNVDAIIYLIDSTKGLQQKDRELIMNINSKNKPYIICLNKIDISHEKLNELEKELESERFIKISSLTGEGLELLKERLEEMFLMKYINSTEDRIIVNERHKEALEKTIKYIIKAVTAIKSGYSLDIGAIEIKEATTSLGTITGEDASEDVVNRIFEKFCLGK